MTLSTVIATLLTAVWRAMYLVSLIQAHHSVSDVFMGIDLSTLWNFLLFVPIKTDIANFFSLATYNTAPACVVEIPKVETIMLPHYKSCRLSDKYGIFWFRNGFVDGKMVKHTTISCGGWTLCFDAQCTCTYISLFFVLCFFLVFLTQCRFLPTACSN